MSFIRDFVTAVKTEQLAIGESMVNGNCVNFESYQRLVGQNIGLEKALSILNDLLEKEKNDVE
jgi:hypothetical protein